MDLRFCTKLVLTLCFIQSSLCQKRLQANILFRHGDRSPCETFPTDIHKESSWPRGWGQLSRQGQERHLELGKFFRRRYPDLIGEFYHPEDIYVRSTDVDRTIMSAASNLAGMFPPNLNETWTTEISGWQPLPIHSQPQSTDDLMVRGNNCPRYWAMCRELWTTRPTPEVIRESTQYADFWRRVKIHAGLPADTELSEMWFIADALLIEKITNRSLPDWVDDDTFQHLLRYQDLNFQMMVYNATLARLAGGNLLHDMQKNMAARLGGKSTRNVYVYSAHDDTVAPLLAALNVYNNLSPPYASSVMLELWENKEKKPFVRVYYRNDTSINPMEPLFLTIPGCNADCPWSDFLRLTKPSLPQDYAKECEMPSDALVLGKIFDTHPVDPKEIFRSVSKSDSAHSTVVTARPTLTPPKRDYAMGWVVFGSIALILSILFIVFFSIFVYIRAYNIRIVVCRDDERVPLLHKDRQ